MNDKQRKAFFGKLNSGNIDSTAVDEIVLTVTNDGNFYRQVLQPNANTIKKRMMRGDFQKEYAKTKKTYVDSLAKQAINKYSQITYSDPMQLNVDTKRALGQELVDEIVESASEQVQSHKLENTDKGKAIMARQKASGDGDLGTRRKNENEIISKGMRGLQ